MEAKAIEIAPYPEVIGVGKLIECECCKGSGSVPDESVSLPWEVTKKCPLCFGKKKYPAFTSYARERMW